MDSDDDEAACTVDDQKDAYHPFVVTLVQKDRTNDHSSNEDNERQQELQVMEEVLLLEQSRIRSTHATHFSRHFN